MSSVACLSDGRFVCANGKKMYIMNEDGTEKEALLAGHSQVTLPQIRITWHYLLSIILLFISLSHVTFLVIFSVYMR